MRLKKIQDSVDPRIILSLEIEDSPKDEEKDGTGVIVYPDLYLGMGFRGSVD